MAMTRRQQAIKEAIQQLNGQGVNVWVTVLSGLIDQAEAGKLREATAHLQAGTGPVLITRLIAPNPIVVHDPGNTACFCPDCARALWAGKSDTADAHS